MTNYSLIMGDHCVYQSREINPNNFMPMFVVEGEFPLEEDFINSLFKSKGILKYLEDYITVRSNDTDLKNFSKDDPLIGAIGLVPYVLYKFPMKWELMAEEIYNYRVGKVLDFLNEVFSYEEPSLTSKLFRRVKQFFSRS